MAAKKSLQPMLVRVPRGRKAPGGAEQSLERGVICVLSVTLRFRMEPYRAMIPNQGDSVHFDGVIRHGFVAVGDEDAWNLAVRLSDKETSRSRGSALRRPRLACGELAATSNQSGGMARFPLTRSLAFSPIMIEGALVLELTRRGITDESATRRPARP